MIEIAPLHATREPNFIVGSKPGSLKMLVKGVSLKEKLNSHHENGLTLVSLVKLKEHKSKLDGVVVLYQVCNRKIIFEIVFVYAGILAIPHII